MPRASARSGRRVKKSQYLGRSKAEDARELEPDQRSDHPPGEAEGERVDHLVIDVGAAETYRVSDSRIDFAWTRRKMYLEPR